MGPESKDSTQFMFSFQRAKEAKADVEMRLEAFEMRLSELSNKIEMGGAPIIQMILTVSHDPKELKKLGEALVRVSQIIKPMDELRAHKAAIELAEQNPESFMSMFGDFTSDIDTLLTNFDSGDA